MINYYEWKSYILKKINNTNYVIGDNKYTEFYWPESDNFEKLTELFIEKNNNVFKCYTLGFTTSEEIEKFIENSDNIGIYYITKSDNDTRYKFLMRFIDFDKPGLQRKSAEEFYQNDKEELSNGNTTIEDIKTQMSKVNGLRFIYVKRKSPESSNLRIERELTDGEFIYVRPE